MDYFYDKIELNYHTSIIKTLANKQNTITKMTITNVNVVVNVPVKVRIKGSLQR